MSSVTMAGDERLDDTRLDDTRLDDTPRDDGRRDDGQRPAAARGATGRASAAEALGERLAELVPDPDAVVAAFRAGLAELTGGPARDGGIELVAGVARGFRRATPRDPASVLLLVADRLLGTSSPAERALACDILERTLPAEPERSWQLLRRAARSLADADAADLLARPYGVGIAAEPYRWAELEQLVYAPSPFERRLVGSTIAALADRADPTDPTSVEPGAVLGRGLPLLRELIGDADPAVQDALAGAFRSLASLDPDAVAAALAEAAATARRKSDGHRARVVLTSLAALPPHVADPIAAGLAGIPIDPAAPSTSRAAAISGQFASMGLGVAPAEPPLA